VNVVTNDPRVSVVMPVHNGELYLREALESILKQTFGDFEFIIIDDGSTDATRDILRSYADPRIRLVYNEHNIGLTKSLNKGLGLAQGEYIARQDADDISHPERLAKQVEVLDNNPGVSILGTAYQRIDSQALPLGTVEVLTDNVELQNNLLVGDCFCHGSVAMRKRDVETVGKYNEAMEPAEDYDLWLRMSERSEVANLPEVLYSYRLHPQSVSATRALEQRGCARLAVEKALERRFREYGSALVSDEALAKCYVNLAIGHLAEGHEEAAREYLGQAFGLVGVSEELHDFTLERLLAVVLGWFASGDLPAWAGRYPDTRTGASFIEAFFGCLPPEAPRVRRERKLLLSRLFISAAFANYQAGDFGNVPRNCVAGVLHHPAWLRNRGVWSIFVRSLFRSWRSCPKSA